MTSYLTTVFMFLLANTIYEIFGNKIKCHMYDLENEVRGQEEDKRA